jgi:transposase InsO family protein
MPDNGFVERFNGTLLEEFFRPALHQKLYDSVASLQADLDAWLRHYNHERPPPRLSQPGPSTLGNDRPIRQTRSLRGQGNALALPRSSTEGFLTRG